MKKAVLAALLGVLFAVSAPAMGNTDRLTNATARAEAAVGKVIPVLKLAAGSDPKIAKALAILEGVTGHGGDAPAPDGFENATTNWVEVLGAGQERTITNPVYRLVIRPPVATPMANVTPAALPVTNIPPATVSNSVPATGGDLLP